MKMDQQAGTRASNMCTLIEDTINDVRNMAYRLRPRVLDDLGLEIVGVTARFRNVFLLIRHFSERHRPASPTTVRNGAVP